MTIQFANNATATLSAGYTNVATALSVTAGQGARFPALSGSNYFLATLCDASNNLEIIKVTARSGDVLTVVRGQEGTAARAYSAGDKVDMRITAGLLAAIRDGNFSATAESNSAGYRGLPQNIQNANYTLALTDACGHVYHDNASPHTWTVPPNSTVAFDIGTTILLISKTGIITVAQGAAVTLVWSPTLATGNRTLAAGGMATLVKTAVNEWFITGPGLS